MLFQITTILIYIYIFLKVNGLNIDRASYQYDERNFPLVYQLICTSILYLLILYIYAHISLLVINTRYRNMTYLIISFIIPGTH